DAPRGLVQTTGTAGGYDFVEKSALEAAVSVNVVRVIVYECRATGFTFLCYNSGRIKIHPEVFV
ncbi:hypothetical protein, partial [Pyramidobacter piscolens]|uniref:hypothetical protein n=1 Tax=Pyramidobacter piscolens TaxID=638849 RepID=UPI00266D8C85